MGHAVRAELEQETAARTQELEQLKVAHNGLIDIIAQLHERMEQLESAGPAPSPPGPSAGGPPFRAVAPEPPPRPANFPPDPPGPPVGGPDPHFALNCNSIRDGGWLILNEWMPGSEMYDSSGAALFLSKKQPPHTPCDHARPDLFVTEFDPAWMQGGYWTSAADVTIDPGNSNYMDDALGRMCHSYETVTMTKQSCMLYDIMRKRPNLCLSWHFPKSSSGGYYIRYACRNCNCATGFYKPQDNIDDDVGGPDLNPLKWSGRDLKKSGPVKDAFRIFSASVLNVSQLMEGGQCRHLQRTPASDPTGWQLYVQVNTPALTNGPMQ